MKKILVFGVAKGIGGIESFFHNYFLNVNHDNFIFDFIAPEGSVAFADDYKKNGSNIFPVSFYSNHPIKYKKQVNEIMKLNNYDVVYINMLSAANLLPLKIAKKNKIKTIIVHSHNADIPSNKFRKILHYINVKKIPRMANKLVACSKKAGNFMFGNNEFTVINNAIITDKFVFSKELRNEIRKELNISIDDYVVGHIGRFCEQKNHDFIIEIAKSLTKENRIKFVLFGEGEFKEKIKNDIKVNNLEDMFILKNNIPDVYKYYNAFDTFILPSKFEGLPVVGIEAQFNGLPCLFSNNITKELQYNENVKFLNIDNIQIWSNEILKKYSRCGVSKELYNSYDIKKQVKIFEDLFDREGE